MLYSINKYPIFSHEYLNTYVSDYDIYSFYLGHRFTVGKIFNSPFHEDRNPSFGIFEINEGKLLYKDYSKGLNGNVINFVQEKLRLKNYKAAIIQIYSDLILDKKKIPINTVKTTHITKRTSIDIGIKKQPFNKEDLRWWGQFNITLDILTKYEVSAIQYMFVGPYIKHEYSTKDPMYAYTVYDKLKIYRPISKKTEKWYGSLNKNYIHGYKQLPKTGDLLIITKSLKDVMCLDSLGYTAVSPSSEGTLIPKPVIDELQTRFKHVIIFYDNDEPGEAYSSRMCLKYNLNSRSIPKKYKEKDTTDFFKQYQTEKTKILLNTLFEEFLVSDTNLVPDEKENT